MLASRSRTGDCYDNAVAESLFATLKTEFKAKLFFPTRQAVHDAVFTYIEEVYNPRRLHRSLGYRTPLELDRQWHEQAA